MYKNSREKRPEMRALRSMLLVLLASTGLLATLLFPSPSQALEPTEFAGSTVYLINAGTGRFLDADANGSVGQSVSPKQDDQWHMSSIGGDTYNLVNARFNRYLDADGADRDYDVNLSGNNRDADTQWQFAAQGDGTYVVTSVEYGQALDGDYANKGYAVNLTQNVEDVDARWYVVVANAPVQDLDGTIALLHNAGTGRFLDIDGGSVDQSVVPKADDQWLIADAGNGQYTRGACAFSTKVINAQQAGAEAAIVFNQGNTEDRTAIIGATLGAASVGVVTIPALDVAYADGVTLSEAASADLSADTTTVTSTTENVIADLPGVNAGNVVMAGAHLDSVQQGPGVQDNGSGSAALLSIALMLANNETYVPQNSLRFAWWGAEEAGLIGSNEYIFNPEFGITDEEYAALSSYLNFDMISSPNYVFGVYDADQSTFEAPVAIPEGSAAIEDLFEAYYTIKDVPYDDSEFSGPLRLPGVHQRGHPRCWPVHRRRSAQDARASRHLGWHCRRAVRPVLPPGMRHDRQRVLRGIGDQHRRRHVRHLQPGRFNRRHQRLPRPVGAVSASLFLLKHRRICGVAAQAKLSRLRYAWQAQPNGRLSNTDAAEFGQKSQRLLLKVRGPAMTSSPIRFRRARCARPYCHPKRSLKTRRQASTVEVTESVSEPATSPGTVATSIAIANVSRLTGRDRSRRRRLWCQTRYPWP
ncbi:Aminopeptidase [Nymphon striatum]|nr:Aminopeptidase [Nymphon striatum]